MLEKSLESPLDSKEINPVNLKGNQPWIFTGRTDAEVPVLWPPDVKSWLIWKDPDAGKDWRQEKKGTAEDEMAGWHHQLNGYKFDQTLGDCKGQGAWHAAVHGVAKSWIWLSNLMTSSYRIPYNLNYVESKKQSIQTNITKQIRLTGTKNKTDFCQRRKGWQGKGNRWGRFTGINFQYQISQVF